VSTRTPLFDESHPMWNVFIKFHTDQYVGQARVAAKKLLFPIHYGTAWDMTYAWATVVRLREEAK
jgi:hypothetical protein